MRIQYVWIWFMLFFASELFAQSAVAPDGSGTLGDPYQISTLNNLYWLSQNSSQWDKYYVQTADIDASSTSGWAGGDGFSPIGNNTIRFTGTYEGNGYCISNLYINRSSTDYIGFFGRVSAAYLSNIIISDANITGKTYVGTLAGRSGGGTISYCECSATINAFSYGGGMIGSTWSSFVSSCKSGGNVTVTSAFAGGLIGYLGYSANLTNSYSTCVVNSGDNQTGGLVGFSYESTISNCHSNGKTTSSADYVGGLVGNSNNSDISESYSTSKVIGEDQVGGLVGYCIDGSTITNSYSTGSVDGTDYVGGLVGYLKDATVTSSYSNAFVGGDYWIGGLVGYCYSNVSISDCYSTGNVNVTGSYAGGLIGTTSYTQVNNCYILGDVTKTNGSSIYIGAFIGSCNGGTISYNYSIGDVTYSSGGSPTDRGFIGTAGNSPTYTNNFWDSDASNQTTATGATARTTAQMKTKSTFTGSGWDFVGESANGNNDYWDMNTDINNGYPFNIGPFSDGVGTSGDPFQISNLTDLRNLSENSNLWDEHFIQTADIDASTTNTWNSGAGFSPIGNTTTNFTGSYDGGNYSIDALFINNSSSSYIGLFGYTYQADIDNIGLTDVSITGGAEYTGGLVGKDYNSTFDQCFVTGSVTGEDRVGLLLGNDNLTTVNNCYASGSVDAEEYIGGLTGYIFKSTYNNCYSRVDVTRTSATGFNNGAFTGRCFDCTVKYSYATGDVSYSGTGDPSSKGFVGANAGTNTYTSNFWDNTLSNQSSATGATSKTTTQMQTKSTFTNASWDFVGESTNGTNDIWLMTALVNDAYPSFSHSMNYWKGSLSTVWSTAGNWSRNSIPSAGENAYIPDVTNDPVIHDHVVCNNLSLENNATLTINSGKSLTTSADIVNEGTVLIKSDENKSGTLLNTGSISGSGTFTIERYASKAKYHYLATPVNSHAKTVFSSAHDFYEYVPGTGWNDLKGSGGTLTNAKGYAIQNKDNNVVYSFSGTPNYGRVSISVTKTGTDGMNLIGNPYPASIDLGTANAAGFLTENASHISGTVYLWDDPGTFGGYASNDYASFNGTTGVAGSRGGHQPTRYISACQGFFVHRASAGSASVLFTDKMRCTEVSSYFYSPEELGKKQILRLSLENDQNAYNQIAIGFLQEASLGFDNLYDARKMKANPSLAFYSLLDEEELVIQGLPELATLGAVSIPLGVETYTNGQYSIRAEDMNDFKTSTAILLEDLQEDLIVDLREVPVYSFYLKSLQRITDRFIIHVLDNYHISDSNAHNINTGTDSPQSQKKSETTLNIYASGNRIYIKNPGMISGSSNIVLMDALGKVVYTNTCVLNNFTSIQVEVPAGVYILMIRNEAESIMKKLYLGK